MRLLTYDDVGELYVTRDLADDDVEPYAILSHTWGKDDEEVAFDEVRSTSGQKKVGYTKIKHCGQQARKDGWQYFWVDTCCINKTNSTELSKAITSMYRWYEHAQVCYVYLADVASRPGEYENPEDRDWESDFRRSRWFTRGWTLQELLAPRQVVFYSKDWDLLGTKEQLKDLLQDVTAIPIVALTNNQPLSQFPVIQRMRWTQNRQTKEKEDQAYCLLGIFGVSMCLRYGEGDKAFRRLQREIDAQSSSDGALSSHHNTSDVRNEVEYLGLCLSSAPYVQRDLFVGRNAEISEIHATLWPMGADAIPKQRRVVVGGIGGVGKTQLVINYAQHHRNSYTSVVWLDATSEQSLHVSFRSIAEQLITPSELEKLDEEQVLTRFRSWLSRPHNTQWLLIFDNHDNPDQFDIADFCPRTSHGSVIITTRSPNEVEGEPVRIQKLTDVDESLEILQRRSRRENVKADIGARALAERLDGLPIALVTAGAYLCNNDLTFQEYLDAYERRWRVGRQSRARSSAGRDQDQMLYTTWNLTYDRLEQNDPEAAQMLKLMAYFDPREMWYELFRGGLPDRPPDCLPASLADRVDFGDMMGTLVKYCLVDLHHVTQSYRIYSMHSCVHDWIFGSLHQTVDTELYCYAFRCVASSIEDHDLEVLRQTRYDRVSRHAVRLTHRRFELCSELRSGFLSHLDEAVWVARMLKEQVQFAAAEQIYKRVLSGHEKVYGLDDTSTLEVVNSLGLLYVAVDKLEDAERMHKRALAGHQRALELDHVLTLETFHNLGIVYAQQKKLAEAAQMLTRALAGKEKVLGPQHISTLRTVGNLGNVYCDQGRLAEAEQMYQRAIAGHEEALGMEYRSTFGWFNNLGNLYVDQGKLSQAEDIYVQALSGKEKLLGPEHISTLRTLGNLGRLYTEQGKLAEAKQMLERALTGFKKALGPEHTSIVETVSGLKSIEDRQARSESQARDYMRYDGASSPEDRQTQSRSQSWAPNHTGYDGASSLGNRQTGVDSSPTGFRRHDGAAGGDTNGP